MRIIRALCCCLAFCAVVSHCKPAGAALPDWGGRRDVAGLSAGDLNVTTLEARILAARRSIQSGEFEIISETDDPRGRDVNTYYLWLAPGDQVRQERRHGQNVQVAVFGDEFVYRYDHTPALRLDDPDRTRRPAVRRYARAEARPGHWEFLHLDPRTLMFVPVQLSLTPYHALEDLVNAPGREGVESHPSAWKGKPSVVVRFSKPKTGNVYEYEAVPSLGYNVVRFRLQGELKDKSGRTTTTFDTTMKCDLQDLSPTVWFPRTIRLESLCNGEPHVTETLTVKVVSVNRPIPDPVFTLAGGNLPAGVVVVPEVAEDDPDHPGRTRRERGMGLIWDGREVRPFTLEDSAAIAMTRGRK